MVILFDLFNLPDDIFETIFATKQQKIIGKVLIKFMQSKGGEITKTEMSYLATELHDGRYITEIEEPGYEGKKVKLSYNKRQFYDRIVTPMKSMGIIYYDLYKKTYRVSTKFSAELSRIGQMWESFVKKSMKKKDLF